MVYLMYGITAGTLLKNGDRAFGDRRFHRVDLPDAVGETLVSAQRVADRGGESQV